MPPFGIIRVWIHQDTGAVWYKTAVTAPEERPGMQHQDCVGDFLATYAFLCDLGWSQQDAIEDLDAAFFAWLQVVQK